MKIVISYMCSPVDRQNFFMKMLPVDLATLAAYLQKNGNEVYLSSFSDSSLTSAEKTILTINPGLLYFSVFTHNRFVSLTLVKRYKTICPKTVIVLGGPFATFEAEELVERYPEIDYVLKNENENSFLHLINSLNNNEPCKKIIESITCCNLSNIMKAPKYEGSLINIDPNEQYKLLITSRGSSEKPYFSSYPRFSGTNIRYRSVKSIISEIMFSNKKFGIIYYAIRDENFASNRQFVIDFCNEIIEKKIYIMWNCSVRPDNVDEELLNIMKSAGLERIFYNTLFLSKKLLSLYSVNNYQQIAKAAEITRRIGLYMTVSLKVGTLEETKNDFAETVRALKKILPGECLISQAAYYPGTILFDKMKESNLMNDSIWFTKTNPVISIRDDKSVKEWISNLKNSASVICESAWYKPKDFDKHRKNNLHDCWVTDILEGDYYLDDEQFSYADRSYRRVITDMQKNPWGYLRLGKLKFREGDFETAEEYYKTVTEIVPAYYGGWLKIAEAQLAQSKRKEAKASIEKASSLSMFDARISNIKKVLKVKKI